MTHISIIIPTYNYATYLAKALQSVVYQLQQGDQVIVVDDGSTDKTEQVVAQFKKVTPILQYIQQVNKGAAAARNVGLKKASGDYVLFLDADDELIDGALEQYHKAIIEQPDIDLFLAGHQVRDEKGKIKQYSPPLIQASKTDNVLAYWKKKIAMSHGAFIAKRTLFDKITYPEILKSGEDIPVFSHLLARSNTGVVNVPVVIINKHSDSLRNMLVISENAIDQLVQLVFNITILPNELLSYKRQFHAQRLLSLSRTYYLNQHYKLAKSWYKKAICMYPLLIFKTSYLRKFLKCVFKRGERC